MMPSAFFVLGTISLLLSESQAWTTRPAQTSIRLFSRLHLSRPSSESCSKQTNVDNERRSKRFDSFSRRDLFAATAGAAASIALGPSTAAFAPAPSIVTTAATCDTTVSVWQRGDRIVYILGTAHISEISSDLAGQLVKDVHPSAVFVELDLKRVSGVTVSPGTPVTSRLPISTDVTELPATGEGASTKQSKIIVSVPALPDSVASRPTESTGIASLAATTKQDDELASASPVLTESPRRGLGQRMLGFGAAAVGKAIQGMYKNLNDSGFKPGEEFVVAVREGQRIGADIVLGDQDVEVTLRRMTQALAQTDLNKLLDPDSELERGMRELMGDSDPSLASSPDAFKSELSTYVENMKTRDSVRKIMTQLQKVAPALVQVMLTERDAYMAAGLDTLNQFEVITAVMGIAHMDGVERNLQSQGWKQMRPSCPRV
jgi:hypothetical protein